MKNLKINLNNHKAILTFKNISHKNFSTLKWELIRQNINEISKHVAINLEEDNQNIEIRKENN